MLADKMVGLDYVDSVVQRDCSAELEKNELRPWKKKEWRIPKMSGEFVARMEDVLDLYPGGVTIPERPVVCFDETSKQLIGHTREFR